MKIYEVFYIEYEHIDNNYLYDDDDYYNYDIEIKKPVKYFDTKKKAKSYIDNKADYNKDYYYQEIEVE